MRPSALASPEPSSRINVRRWDVLEYLTIFSLNACPEVHGDNAAYEAGPSDGVSIMAWCLDFSETTLWREVIIPPSKVLPWKDDSYSGSIPKPLELGGGEGSCQYLDFAVH